MKLNARLAKLEKDYADLLEGGDETKRRYSSLLTMVRELTTNTVQASAKAAESAEKPSIIFGSPLSRNGCITKRPTKTSSAKC